MSKKNSNNDNTSNETGISKSKQKRLAQEQARKAEKEKKIMGYVWPVLIIFCIAAIIFAIQMLRAANIPYYSKPLTDQGTVKGVNAGDVTVDYASMSFKKSELMPSESVIEQDLMDLQKNYEALSEDPDKMTVSGDKVNVTYTSTLDGVSSDSALAEEGGRNLTIGFATLGEEFDEALLGRKKGDNFTVSVNYAEDYYDEDRAGKTAEYDVTVQGIYELPEITDEFIAANNREGLNTVEEYKQYLRDHYYDESIKRAVASSLSTNSAVAAYPEGYVENVRETLAEQYKAQYDSQSAQFQMYGLDPGTEYEMFGYETEEAYNAFLEEQAKEKAAYALELDYIFKDAGLTNTKDEVKAYWADRGYMDAGFDSLVKEFGYPYVAQSALQAKVLDYLATNANVTE